jgi:hypothetical protein
VFGSITDDPPCFWKQGIRLYITGGESAAGRVAGSGTVRPQIVAGSGTGCSLSDCAGC